MAAFSVFFCLIFCKTVQNYTFLSRWRNFRRQKIKLFIYFLRNLLKISEFNIAVFGTFCRQGVDFVPIFPLLYSIVIQCVVILLKHLYVVFVVLKTENFSSNFLFNTPIWRVSFLCMINFFCVFSFSFFNNVLNTKVQYKLYFIDLQCFYVFAIKQIVCIVVQKVVSLRHKLKLFIEFCMKEKVLDALSAINGQYNLPKEQLEKIAATAPAFESEDKISSWVDSLKPMLGVMQSYADSRVTAQQKELSKLREELDAAKKERDGSGVSLGDDLEKRLGVMLDARLSAYKEQMDELAKANKELSDKVLQSEVSDRERQFSEIKKRVAGELGISEELLSLVDGKLDAGMDESKINEVLSDCKKKMVKYGLKSVETQSYHAGSKELANERAKEYLEQFKARQNGNQ